MEETDLIESVKKGNDHAFEILINQNKDMVFSICVKITEDFHLAEEAAQDTFLKAYQQINRFKGASKFSSWIYKIALNTSYNKIRQRKPSSTSIELIEELEENSFLSGFELMRQEDQKEYINLALAQLDKLDALIISLFYLEEQSIDELVVITDLTKANIKVKLHRARKKLKETMGSFLADKKNEI